MIEFTRMHLSHFAVHNVGNKNNQEDLFLSEREFKFKDDSTKDIVLNYLTKSLQSDVFYRFRQTRDEFTYDVKSLIDKVFADPKKLFETSKHLAEHLYHQSVHPKVKGGELYFAYLNDLKIDGNMCDAIGIFKSETKDTFIKVFAQSPVFDIEIDHGIALNKLDKAVLIFNTEAESGYKSVMIDNSSKIAEAAAYWSKDFLDMELKPSAYFHTSNFIESCVDFCENVLTDENNVRKLDQQRVLNNSVNYFKDNETFNKDEFERRVIVQPEVINAFKEYQSKYYNDHQLNEIEEFPISQTAVKKNSKYMKSVIKLDKNFHIYVHSKHEYIEKGYDENTGMKFYKLFFESEE